MKLYKKIIVYLIIILFISAGVVAGLNPERQNINDQDGEEIDWWPMFQHDPGRTGYSTSHGPETNTTLWKVEREFAFSSPVVVNNRVYVGGDGKELFCFDADKGEELWNYSTGWWGVSSPVVAEGKVYFSSIDYRIYCLNAETGELIWSFYTGDISFGYSAPLVYNKKVYVHGSGLDCYLYCLNSSTGEEIWNVTIGWLSGPTIWNGKIFLGLGPTPKNNIFCLDAETGEMIWSENIPEGVHNFPTVSDGKLYVVAGDFIVYCLDAENGSQYWKSVIGDCEFPITCSPAVYEEILLILSDKLYCLNKNDGSKVWTYNTTGDYYNSNPAISDGRAYFGDGKGWIYCLDVNSGHEIWKYSADRTIHTSPAVADGELYVGSGNWLYCFADPFLDIGEINGGFGRIGVELLNPGDESALNITYTISVKGGLFGNIDVETTKSIPRIKYNVTILDYPDMFIFGFGKITIRVTAYADNADLVSKEKEGYVIGPFVIVP